MKKRYYGVMALGCGLLLLTGCGDNTNVEKNKFSCTCSVENEYVGKESETVTFYYDKDWKKIESVDFEIGYEVSDENMADFESYVEELEDICETQKIEKCDVTVNVNKIYLNATSTPDTFGFPEEISKDELEKNLFEDAGDDVNGCVCK